VKDAIQENFFLAEFCASPLNVTKFSKVLLSTNLHLLETMNTLYCSIQVYCSCGFGNTIFGNEVTLPTHCVFLYNFTVYCKLLLTVAEYNL